MHHCISITHELLSIDDKASKSLAGVLGWKVKASTIFCSSLRRTETKKNRRNYIAIEEKNCGYKSRIWCATETTSLTAFWL